MHEIRETSDVRFMPEITFGYVQELQIPHLIPLNTINIVSYNKFPFPSPGRTGRFLGLI